MNDIKWHARLGHIGHDRLKRLAKASLLGPIKKIYLPICEQCLAGKGKKDCFLEKPREQLFL